MNRFLLSALFTAVAGILFATGLIAQQNQNPIVVIDTSKGKIEVELYADKAPNTVKNFLKYVEDKHYDGVIFHRVIEDFMIQGGGMDPDMAEKKTREPIQNEAKNGVANTRGTIAMARTNNPHSATAQFFINVKDNDFLDQQNARDGWGYCVFGKVVDADSMKVVDTIRKVPTTTRAGHQNVPTDPVLIRSVKRK